MRRDSTKDGTSMSIWMYLAMAWEIDSCHRSSSQNISLARSIDSSSFCNLFQFILSLVKLSSKQLEVAMLGTDSGTTMQRHLDPNCTQAALANTSTCIAFLESWITLSTMSGISLALCSLHSPSFPSTSGLPFSTVCLGPTSGWSSFHHRSPGSSTFGARTVGFYSDMLINR